jgi:hypothetical protein
MRYNGRIMIIGGAMVNKAFFDYETASKELQIPASVMRDFEAQAHREFPGDNMLMELHVLRALKAKARNGRREIKQ